MARNTTSCRCFHSSQQQRRIRELAAESGNRPRLPSDASPERAGKGAAEDDVVGCLIRRAADVALNVLEDVLVAEGRLALDAVVGEEPAEELDSGRSEVAPDEVEGGGSLLTTHGSSLYHAKP